MPSQPALHSPKRRSEGRDSFAWYGYYAAYSTRFVQDVLEQLALPKGARVLDPWNGSGTTTFLAHDMGFSAIGFDINPAMVIVAKARSLDPEVKESLPVLCANLLEKALDDLNENQTGESEPLGKWLVPESATAFRRIERAVQLLLVSEESYEPLFKATNLKNVSSLAAFFYTALFRTLNEILDTFRASNPTWIKEPTTPEQRLKPSVDQIHNSFRSHVLEMTKVLERRIRRIPNHRYSEPDIEIASSEAIPLEGRCVRAVISSPPYCTRIDYVIATKPELALLGCSGEDDVQALRSRTIGTPTISKKTPDWEARWGPTCSRFLEAVANHSSKASKAYYLKNYLQYFSSLYASLFEIDRTLVEGGDSVLVAQDSYYKDVHLNLPGMITEMGDSLGWKLKSQSRFTNTTMAGINSKAREYGRSSEATESVLFFEKAA